MTALAAAGLALYGEVEDVDGWIKLPLRKFKTTMASLGPDGASHEGVPYWSYGLEYMLKFMDLAGDLLGEDLFKDSAWFRNTASFCLYSMLPRKSWTRRSHLMTFADGPRHHWYGPDYLLRKLAGEYRDARAQWLADALDAADLCGWQGRFLNLLWVDPAVKPAPPADLPTFRHFEDMGLVFMRSGWDGDEALLAFKCGPHIGHHAIRKYSYDPGGGHVHPDAGAFLLFACGDWLIVDDGYAHKQTAWQNTALVNGVGQIGEGRAWFQGGGLCARHRGASILRAESGPQLDYVIGNVAPAYKDQAGLKKFLRHVLYVKGACWVIIDEFETARPAKFELFFHADFPFRGREGACVVAGPKGALRLTPLRPLDVSAETAKQALRRPGGEGPARKIDSLVLANSNKRRKALFITVLEASPAGSPFHTAAAVVKAADGECLTIRTPDRTWKFALLPHRKDLSSPIWRRIQ